ncbi:hypothetical protein [Microseira wollei]|uniref:Uncharacterized protein n=1 Tax=Microseira wollei NIES-4236 TaxID=2530354 RepID=A0AAV3X657_9CYAN|nr:hypothetical protein [Microseira wollei]GET36721.1 hypothetical protein MiSe_14730 [Microseira wollei NIES-4236]
MNALIIPKLNSLPVNVPVEGVVQIELEEGVLIFRASSWLQNRIEELLEKQQETALTPDEEKELDCYEEIDDYLSFVNRTIRNL